MKGDQGANWIPSLVFMWKLSRKTTVLKGWCKKWPTNIVFHYHVTENTIKRWGPNRKVALRDSEKAGMRIGQHCLYLSKKLYLGKDIITIQLGTLLRSGRFIVHYIFSNNWEPLISCSRSDMGKAGGKSITRVITKEQAHTDFQAVRARSEFASCHVDPRVLD